MKDMITITTEHTYTAEALAGFYLARCLSGVIYIDTAAAIRALDEAQGQVKALFERGGQQAFEAGFVDAVQYSFRILDQFGAEGIYSACAERWQAVTGRDFPWTLLSFKAHVAAINAELK